DEGAKRFGWAQRMPKPGSMRDGDTLVGWGTATSVYPSNIAAATARVTLYLNKTARAQVATHEIGTGVITVCALVVADRLGLAPENVAVEVGDSNLPPAPVSGGSNSTASVSNALVKACEEIATKRAQGARGAIEAYAENIPHGGPGESIEKLYKGQPSF